MTSKDNKRPAASTVKRLRGRMRNCALAYRRAVQPRKFDGTPETYHRQIQEGMKQIREAIRWRNISQRPEYHETE